MNEHISTTLFVIDYRKYDRDIVFIAISPYEGQKYVIVKGASLGPSKRAKIIDIGNIIKAKVYQRNHWYLSEAESFDSFSYLKQHLSLIVLFQALLTILKHTYMVPEKKIYNAVITTLQSLKEGNSLEKDEITLFLLILRVFAFYDLVTFPPICSVCAKTTYTGSLGGSAWFCEEHAPLGATPFSFHKHESRIEILQKLFKDSLNIRFIYSPLLGHPAE